MRKCWNNRQKNQVMQTHDRQIQCGENNNAPYERGPYGANAVMTHPNDQNLSLTPAVSAQLCVRLPSTLKPTASCESNFPM